MRYVQGMRLGIGILLLIGGFANMSAAEEIAIVGTGSGTAILQALADAFHQQHADVTLTIPPSVGSDGGIKAVGRDEAVLGRVSRGIKDPEKPYNLTYVAYANVPIVFYTNPDVTVPELTIQQVLDIYNGKITNWKDVGGPDGGIRVITREEGDSSMGILAKTLPGFKDVTVTPKAKTTFSDPETEETIVKTSRTIGYGAYANVKALAVNVIKIAGKGPADADYPYVGTLGLIYKGANYTGTVQQFVKFVTSEAAQAIIQAAGGLSLPK